MKSCCNEPAIRLDSMRIRGLHNHAMPMLSYTAHEIQLLFSLMLTWVIHCQRKDHSGHFYETLKLHPFVTVRFALKDIFVRRNGSKTTLLFKQKHGTKTWSSLLFIS